jgi:hypothetical protein
MQTYFQFELSMLAYAPSPGARLSAILDTCCMKMGARILTRLEAGEMEADPEARLATVAHDTLPTRFNSGNQDHVRLVLGMHALHVRGGDAPSMIADAQQADRFHARMAQRFGAFPFVRLREDILWSAHRGELPWRDVAVLCAIYATIGANENPVRITRDMIVARALGYKRKADVTDAELARRQDKARPLSTDHLRYTLDRLEARKLFSRVQVSRRLVVFSHRLDRAELADAAVAIYGKPHPVRLNRANDRAVQARVKRAQASYHSGENQRTAENSPLGPHNVPTRVPTQFPTRFPTKIEAPLIEPSSENPRIEAVSRSAGGPSAHLDNHTASERQRLLSLAELAESVGTPAARRDAEGYRQQAAALPAAVEASA